LAATLSQWSVINGEAADSLNVLSSCCQREPAWNQRYTVTECMCS